MGSKVNDFLARRTGEHESVGNLSVKPLIVNESQRQVYNY